MLKKAKFKVEFVLKPYGLLEESVRMEECFILPYRTEESYHHESSLAYRSALMEIMVAASSEDHLISIKRICLLTEYEEIKEENKPSMRKIK